MILGATQKEIENEYYMVDLPELIKQVRFEESSTHLLNLQMLVASNNRGLDDDSYTEFVRNLTKNLVEENKNEDENQLDRNALETLRFMTNQGANSTGGR